MRFWHMWCWKLHGRVENGTLVLRVLNWVLKTEQTNKNMLCIFVRQADEAGSENIFKKMMYWLVKNLIQT